jgi:tRNA (uracil-5-)-methyltransferase TRM9
MDTQYNEFMKSQTAARLLSLNKQFYQTFGYEFSSTRQRLQPGVMKVLDRLNGRESILDLGCGNGEIARELMRRGHRGPYTGVDYSQPLLDVARRGWEDAPATFIRLDLLSPGWENHLHADVSQPFDYVTAFAVLHHIPGEATRLKILKKIHILLQKGGFFVHSEWQFLASDKLKGRIQPWGSVDILPEQVDPNDYLLDWRSGGHGLRYVHHFDEAELGCLAEASCFRVRETFHSDGASGLLGLYQVWEAL